jgi:hypothetical protein
VYKICLFLIAVFFLASCGRGISEPPEELEIPASPALDDFLPEGIPVYPGAEPVEYPEEYFFLGEGVNSSAFETPDGIAGVYRFYRESLSEGGLRASGDVVLSAQPHFVLEVKRAGEDYAVIQAGEYEDRTRIMIMHFSGQGDE